MGCVNSVICEFLRDCLSLALWSNVLSATLLYLISVEIQVKNSSNVNTLWFAGVKEFALNQYMAFW